MYIGRLIVTQSYDTNINDLNIEKFSNISGDLESM